MAPTRPIREGQRIIVEKPEVDLSLRTRNNFRLLGLDATKAHLGMLGRMLGLLSRCMYDKLPEDGGQNNAFQHYLLRLKSTLEAMMLKHTIDGMKPNRDVSLDLAIDPTASGFPLFVRDIHLMEKDAKDAQTTLASLPADGQLVDNALYHLFRGYFPDEVILQKLQRDYAQKLLSFALPVEVDFQPIVLVKEEPGVAFYKKSVGRLDDTHNLPRFYTFYFKAFSDTGDWGTTLRSAITQSFSPVTDYELETMAKAVESIDGIQLQLLERFDVGPFCNRFTENGAPIEQLLERGKPEDSLLSFKRTVVQRIGQKPKTGFKNWLRELFDNGDWQSGIFTPPLSSPRYVLMPHRLIQKAYAQNITFGPNVRMFGITSDGGLA